MLGHFTFLSRILGLGLVENYTTVCIIELVDSIYEALMATYFMATYHLSSSAFMINNMSSGTKKHRESTEPESHQMAKIV